MRDELQSLMHRVYYDHKKAGSYSGIQALRRQIEKEYGRRPSLKQVKEWLRDQDVYTLHRERRKVFPRAPIVVRDMDDQWELDLVEMQPFAKYNGGMRYILCCIDVLSKMAWAMPVKRKTAEQVSAAFQCILEQAHPRCPRSIRTDRGKEFCNTNFKALCVKYSIHAFTTNSDQKCAVIERWNRTLKSRMWRYFRHESTLVWTDVLQNLVNAYNHSFHRSIKCSPIEVNKSNEMEIWHRLYDGKLPETRSSTPSPKFKVGMSVRISLHNPANPFTKGYKKGWSEEVFEIKSHHPKHYPHLYSLSDAKGEELEGKFYEHELQQVSDAKKLWIIDKVLDIKKRKNGQHYYLVQWRDSKKPSWVHQKDLRKI